MFDSQFIIEFLIYLNIWLIMFYAKSCIPLHKLVTLVTYLIRFLLTI